MRLYEGFILIDSVQANRGLESIMEDITKLLEKHGGVIVRSSVWGERKLAYEVRGARRGTYLLYYFKMDPLKVDDFKKDFKLYDKALRIMIVREDRSEEEILGEENLLEESQKEEEKSYISTNTLDSSDSENLENSEEKTSKEEESVESQGKATVETS